MFLQVLTHDYLMLLVTSFKLMPLAMLAGFLAAELDAF